MTIEWIFVCVLGCVRIAELVIDGKKKGKVKKKAVKDAIKPLVPPSLEKSVDGLIDVTVGFLNETVWKKD